MATETAAQERVASEHAEEGKTVDLIQPPREPAKVERSSLPLSDQEQLVSQSAEIKRRGPTAIEVCVGLAVAVILAAFYWTYHTSPPSSETTSQPGSTAHLHSAGVANSDPDLFRKATRPTWQDFVIPQGASIETELVRTIKLQGQNQQIEAVTFSPDGRLLATASEQREDTAPNTVTFSNGSLQLWDADSGALVRVLQISVDAKSADAVWCAAFSPDSRLVAVTAETNIFLSNQVQGVQIWEAGSGSLLKNLPTTGTYAPERLAFSSDGKLLAGAIGMDTVLIWDLESQRLIRQLKHPNNPTDLAFQPGSHLLAVADNDQRQAVLLWDVDGPRLLHALHSNPPSYGSAVAFSPDGRTLATGHVNGRLHLWDVSEGRIIRTLRPADRNEVDSAAFSPEGGILAAVGFDRTEFWNPNTGNLLSVSEISSGRAHGNPLTFHPTEPLLAVVSGDSVEVRKLKPSSK